jgi:DNA-binding GntR family transcriptional regulator
VPRTSKSPAGIAPKTESPKLTGSKTVYLALRRAIISLEIEPGTVLDEAELCRRYKVSRTPVREALIRLSSEGLVEGQPNRGARVSPLQLSDVIDHYEAMDVLMPVAGRFAAVRRTAADVALLKETVERFETAVRREDFEGMIESNHDLHVAIGNAGHNRCLARGYTQMLGDKLRLAQHGLTRSGEGKARALAKRFAETARRSAKLVRAIEQGNANAADAAARALNEYVRGQVIDVLKTSDGRDMPLSGPDNRLRDLAKKR